VCELAATNLTEDRMYLVRELTDESLRLRAMVDEVPDGSMLIRSPSRYVVVERYHVRLEWSSVGVIRYRRPCCCVSRACPI
jgi:hypothetical protein